MFQIFNAVENYTLRWRALNYPAKDKSKLMYRFKMMMMLTVYWNYYFGSPDKLIMQACKARIY